MSASRTAASTVSSSKGRGPACTAMVSACSSASRSGASRRRAAARMADSTFCSRDRSAAAPAAPRPGGPSGSAAAAQRRELLGGRAPGRGRRGRRGCGSAGSADPSTSSSCGKTSRTASRIRSAVRRLTAQPLGHLVQRQALGAAASSRASSSSRARLFVPHRYLRPFLSYRQTKPEPSQPRKEFSRWLRSSPPAAAPAATPRARSRCPSRGRRRRRPPWSTPCCAIHDVDPGPGRRAHPAAPQRPPPPRARSEGGPRAPTPPRAARVAILWNERESEIIRVLEAA